MKEWETKRPNIAIIGCGKSRKSTLSQVIKMIERLEEFEAIGTIEEFKAIKQWKSDIIESFSKYDVNSVDELMKRFRELTEKAEPKKLVINRQADVTFYHCPRCNELMGNSILAILPRYCRACGQRFGVE